MENQPCSYVHRSTSWKLALSSSTMRNQILSSAVSSPLKVIHFALRRYMLPKHLTQTLWTTSLGSVALLLVLLFLCLRHQHNLFRSCPNKCQAISSRGQWIVHKRTSKWDIHHWWAQVCLPLFSHDFLSHPKESMKYMSEVYYEIRWYNCPQ